MSGLRRLPAIADLCCGRNETVRASFEAGSMPLDEYVRRESLKAVENAKMAPLTDPAGLYARAGEYAAQLLGPDAGRDIEAAMHCMAACTADHHGGYRGKYVPIMSVGQVELDNSTYARGICAYLKSDGKQTFPIYKETLHSQLASCAGPMTPEMYARLRRKHIDEVDPSDQAGGRIADHEPDRRRQERVGRQFLCRTRTPRANQERLEENGYEE